MKKTILTLIALTVLYRPNTYAQPVAESPGTNAAAVAAPAPPRANSAIIPNLSAGFNAKHAANLAVAQKGDIDVLFMGDSITDFWRNSPGNRRGAPPTGAAANSDAPAPMAGNAVFDKHFGSMKVANFGIAGDTTQGVLWRLLNGEGQGYKPKAIMLMIGTNNTGRNSADEISMGIADIVFEMR